LPQQPTPEQVDLAVGDEPAAPILKEGIGEMRGEDDIVAADIPAQKLRHLALHAQDQPGQDARIVLEQTVRARAGADCVQRAMEIAARIEHGEEIVVLEDVELA
jgi:hypothetical protein